MAALDFPSSPAVGQIFQQSESQPCFMWDGVAWNRMARPKGVARGGFRNVLINGDMGVYRRNFPAANFAGTTYLADRWLWVSNGTYVNVAWALMSSGAVIGCEAARCLQMTVNSIVSVNNYGFFVQKLESAKALIGGEPYTLSFWGNSGGTARPFAFELQRVWGTGGSPSAGESLIGQKVFNTTASLWTRFVHTFIAPSSAGKVFGTSGTDCVWIIFWLDAGGSVAANASNIGQQSGTWQFTGFQLEHGSVATPFERRPAAVERLLCQRFYNSGTYYEQFPSPSTGGFAKTIGVEFPATMRATPSMVRNWSATSNVSTFSAQGTYPWAHYEQLVSVGMANISGTFGWEANAEL